jgi:hypothetical protein
LGEGISAAQLNDDRLGRGLDQIYQYAEVLNPNIKLHILPDKGIREEIIAPVNQGAAPTEF